MSKPIDTLLDFADALESQVDIIVRIEEPLVDVYHIEIEDELRGVKVAIEFGDEPDEFLMSGHHDGDWWFYYRDRCHRDPRFERINRVIERSDIKWVMEGLRP